MLVREKGCFSRGGGDSHWRGSFTMVREVDKKEKERFIQFHGLRVVYVERRRQVYYKNDDKSISVKKNKNYPRTVRAYSAESTISGEKTKKLQKLFSCTISARARAQVFVTRILYVFFFLLEISTTIIDFLFFLTRYKSNTNSRNERRNAQTGGRGIY